MAKSKEEKDQQDGRKPSALDRAIQSAMGEGRTVGSDSDPARERYPTLWDWLSRIYIGVGHVRQPATITLTLGPSGVLVSISDRDLGVSCGAACDNLDDALASLEVALSSPTAPIRSWGKKEPKLRKRNTQ